MATIHCLKAVCSFFTWMILSALNSQGDGISFANSLLSSINVNGTIHNLTSEKSEMPRTRRFEVPGALVHIMAHSIEGKDFFRDDQDRDEFLSRLTKGLKKTGYLCYDWALMDNHYHLLIRTNDLPMRKLMQGLNGGYAGYYNKKYKRRGYLVQDRFKSIICQDQVYAVQISKYINLNPFRAGKVSSIEELKHYSWCGHAYLIGVKGARGEEFQNREGTLRRFGDTEEVAVENYNSLIKEEIDNTENAGRLPYTESTEIIKSCKGFPAVIGEPEFVKQTFEDYHKNLNKKHRKADYPYVLVTTRDSTCRQFDIEPGDIFKRGRLNRRSMARAMFCYLLHKEELVPLSVIAEYLRITIGPVACLVTRGECMIKQKERSVPLQKK